MPLLQSPLLLPSLSVSPSFILLMPLLHPALPHSLYRPASLSLMLTQKSCQCLLLLIQVSDPAPVQESTKQVATKKGRRGEGQAEPLEKILSVSLNLLSRLSLCPPSKQPPPPFHVTELLILTPTSPYKQPTPEWICACLPTALFDCRVTSEHVCYCAPPENGCSWEETRPPPPLLFLISGCAPS